MEYNDKTSLTLRSVEGMQFTIDKASKKTHQNIKKNEFEKLFGITNPIHGDDFSKKY